MKKLENWWSKAFQKGFWPLSQLMSSRDWTEKASKEILFIVKLLKLPEGARFLDVGCGIGRHSIELANHGYRAVGLDISRKYVNEATARARKIKPKPVFLKKDMRKIEFKNEFDAAISLFTSFGYFPKKADDILSVRRIYRSLKPGGALVMDLFNGTPVKKSLDQLAQKGESLHEWMELSNGSLLLQNPIYISRKNATLTRWIHIENGRRREVTSFTRAYTKKSLLSLLEKIGFQKIRFFGGLDGSRFCMKKSNRLVAVGIKPR